MSTEELKALVSSEVDKHRQQLTELSLKIHANPELGFHEFQAATWLTEFLREKDFFIEQGVGKLPTAFKASYGRGRPVISIMAEYDALPELGHACGHNLIAASAAGAGLASRVAVNQLGGSIAIIGTPAEELHGGKGMMVKNGAFGDIDIAMMVHPSTVNTATTQALTCQTLDVEFIGKPAHAAARPELGINALEAMIQSFNAINSLRQHIRSTARIHGIITDGGEAANIVPAHSAGIFMIRTEDDAYLDELKQKVLNCFMGASTTTGARLKYTWGEVSYSSMLNNMQLARLFQKNMQALGRRVSLADTGMAFGSTDMGNISQLVPSIHARIAITRKQVLIHSPQFARAAASEAGIKGMIDGAKAMAMTVVDLLSDPETVIKIKKEFKQSR